MELFNTKLNRGYVFAHGEPGCEGMTVIPPGNLMSSKEDGCPKSDGVNDRFTCWSIISIKDDLSTLRAGKLIEASFGSGRTPKTTFVEYLEVKGCIETMETCTRTYLN